MHRRPAGSVSSSTPRPGEVLGTSAGPPGRTARRRSPSARHAVTRFTGLRPARRLALKKVHSIFFAPPLSHPPSPPLQAPAADSDTLGGTLGDPYHCNTRLRDSTELVRRVPATPNRTSPPTPLSVVRITAAKTLASLLVEWNRRRSAASCGAPHSKERIFGSAFINQLVLLMRRRAV
jgi:hypothetical protein